MLALSSIPAQTPQIFHLDGRKNIFLLFLFFACLSSGNIVFIFTIYIFMQMRTSAPAISCGGLFRATQAIDTFQLSTLQMLYGPYFNHILAKTIEKNAKICYDRSAAGMEKVFNKSYPQPARRHCLTGGIFSAFF